MRGPTASVSPVRLVSGLSRPEKASASDSGSPFDAALNAALRPTARAASQSAEEKSPAVEREKPEAQEEDAEEKDPPTPVGTPLIFPFAPTPSPLLALIGELPLAPGLPADAAGDALAAGGDTAVAGNPTTVEGGTVAAAVGDGGAVAPAEAAEPDANAVAMPDPETAQAESASTDLGALLAEFAPAPEDKVSPEGLRPRVAPAIPPTAAGPDATATPAVTPVTSTDEPPSDVAQIENQASPPEGTKPASEMPVEKTVVPDEGVMEGVRNLSAPRHEPAPVSTSQGESQPVSATTQREVPTQIARLSASLVRELSGDGVKEIRLRLDPPSLGEIHVRVESERGELRIHVVAASPETAALLSDGQSNLREELARQGMALANFSAGTEIAFNFASQGGFTPREQPGSNGSSATSARMDDPTLTVAPTRRASNGRLDVQA